MPKVLTEEQKWFRMKLCQDNLDSLKADPNFLDKIITGDECWVSLLEVELKKDSKEWHPRGTHADRPLKALRNRSQRKVMVTVFFDRKGVVLIDFLPAGETINEEYYGGILRTLKERVRRKRLELWGGRNEPHKFLLHHDNASPHISVLTLAFIGSSGIDMIPHPPYSLDLAACDFFLFPRLKAELRGHKHRNVADLRVAITRTLEHLPVQNYSAAINSLPVRWMKCIKASGQYFEGRHLAIDPLGDHELEFEFAYSDEESDSD